jgi:hypothetical protein
VPTPRSAASAVTSSTGGSSCLGWNGHNALSLVDIYDTQTNYGPKDRPCLFASELCCLSLRDEAYTCSVDGTTDVS